MAKKKIGFLQIGSVLNPKNLVFATAVYKDGTVKSGWVKPKRDKLGRLRITEDEANEQLNRK
jgi:hypothetical protein